MWFRALAGDYVIIFFTSWACYVVLDRSRVDIHSQQIWWSLMTALTVNNGRTCVQDFTACVFHPRAFGRRSTPTGSCCIFYGLQTIIDHLSTASSSSSSSSLYSDHFSSFPFCMQPSSRPFVNWAFFSLASATYDIKFHFYFETLICHKSERLHLSLCSVKGPFGHSFNHKNIRALRISLDCHVMFRVHDWKT